MPQLIFGLLVYGAFLGLSAPAQAADQTQQAEAHDAYSSAKIASGIVVTSVGALLLTGGAVDAISYANGQQQQDEDASYGSCRSADHLSPAECHTRSRGAATQHASLDDRYMAAGAVLVGAGIGVLLWGIHGRSKPKAASGGLFERSDLRFTLTPQGALATTLATRF